MKKKEQKLKQNNLQFIVKLFFCLLIIVGVAFVFYWIFKATGIWEKINSIEKIKAIVERGGVFSAIIFVLLQILQTTILQVPAILVTIAGTLVFGRVTAFVLSFVAVMLGSIIMFWIGRKAGRKFLNFLVGEHKAGQWIEKISKGKYVFFLMMVFPLFPDDILCAVAGVTNMSFSFFFWTNVIARAIGIGCTVFFATGAIIPFSGWGLVVWGVIAVVVGVLFYISIKYQNKIDGVVKEIVKK